MRNFRAWLGLVIGVALGFVASTRLPAEAARNSGGTYSLPNGPVSSGQTISSTWANSTLNDLASEMTNSLDRGGRGAMTAALQHSSGTSGAPSLTFSAETSSGWYREASQDLRCVINGSAVQKWTSTGSTFFKSLTVTPSAAASTGVTATGVGGAPGVQGTGGSTDAGVGVVGIAGNPGAGTYTSYGVYGRQTWNTGALGGGVLGVYSRSDQEAASFSGLGVAAGVVGAGLGYGVEGFSLDGGYAGVLAQGGWDPTVHSTSSALRAVACSSGALSASCLSSTVRARAISAYGDISMSTTPNLVGDAGFANTLTPSNIVKSWAHLTLAAGNPTINSSFNVASVTCATNTLTVTMAQAMTGTNDYAITATVTAGIVTTTPSSTTAFTISALDNAGAAINLCTAVGRADFIAIGWQ